jgi:integrase
MATDLNLTDSKIAALKVPTRDYLLYRDRQVAGLAVRVTCAGGRSFTFDYRTAAGRKRRMTLGAWSGEFGIVAARAKATALAVQIEAGGDPMQSADDAVIAYKGRPTVAMLAAKWMRQHVEPDNRPRTVREYRSILDRYVLPKLGTKAVADVTTGDLIDLINEIRREHAVTSNRVRAVLSAMLNHGIVLGWIATSPINKAVRRAPEAAHERYLTPEEFTRLNIALDHCQSRQAADAIRLLAWCGSRKGETLSAKWSEFDLVQGVWTKPSHHTKQKRTHTTALHPEALALLLDMKSRPNAHPTYLFPGADGGPLKDIKKTWRGLMTRTGIKEFRIHDLRHTFASRLIGRGATLPEIGKLLGHTQSNTTARYAHLSLEAQRETLARLPSPSKPVALIEEGE